MVPPDEQKTYRVFLRLLAVAQFALVVTAGAALGLIYMVYGDTAARAANPNRAAELHALATYRPVLIGAALVSGMTVVGGLISGVNIWRQRGRGFSQFIAVVSLLLFPIGTAIGLVTLIVLGQKPIRELYQA